MPLEFLAFLLWFLLQVFYKKAVRLPGRQKHNFRKNTHFWHPITFSGCAIFMKIYELFHYVEKYFCANFCGKPTFLTCSNKAAKMAIFGNHCIFYIVGAGKHIFEDFKNKFTSTSDPTGRDCWLIYFFYTALPAPRAGGAAAFGPMADKSATVGCGRLPAPWCVCVFVCVCVCVCIYIYVCVYGDV